MSADANGRETMTTTTPSTDTDAPAFDFMQSVYQLPVRVQSDERLVAIHAEFVRKLTHESAGLEMTTLQTILIERIANGYVLLRYHEDHPGEWVGVNTEKDFTQNWRVLVQEFNKILASGEDKRRDALRLAHQDIMLSGLEKIESAENRKAVREFYMNEFAAIGE